MNSYQNRTIHFDIVKKVIPLAIIFLCVYTPYSFFISNDPVSGWSELISLVILVLSLHSFRQENTHIVSNFLIGVGFPVLIPWIFSGGPSGHALWWSPVYSLWVSYFAFGKRYFTWMGLYAGVMGMIAFASHSGMFTIAYSDMELLNILFATTISTFLIHFYEKIRSYYEHLSKMEAQKTIEMHEQYVNLLESAPDAIIVYDNAFRIVMANLQAEKVFGYSKAELMGYSFKQLIRYHDTSEISMPQLFAAVEMQLDKSPKLTGKRKDGSLFSAEINTSKNEKEGIVTATIRDISERVLMTNILLKQNKQLESFTHMASHNLRGPVGNLHSLLYLYNTETSADEREFLMGKFEKVVGNLNDTLNELLEMIELNHARYKQRSLLDFSTIFTKITESFGPEIKLLNAEVSADFEKAPEVEYTYVYLESIMQNLLSNALKYRSPERAPKVHFESQTINGQTMLKVSDNGRGINLSENGEQLFGFLQTFHSNPDAKGLGLFMTKKHVDSMGGEITVDSEVGIGTTFNIVFNKQTGSKQFGTYEHFQSN
jgi:PAS domain S-box-containing protein